MRAHLYTSAPTPSIAHDPCPAHSAIFVAALSLLCAEQTYSLLYHVNTTTPSRWQCPARNTAAVCIPDAHRARPLHVGIQRPVERRCEHFARSHTCMHISAAICSSDSFGELRDIGQGKCLYYREWNRPQNTLENAADDGEEQRLMFGMLYSLKVRCVARRYSA